MDDNNEQVGVVDIIEAKRRAKEAGLDLVEVSPQSSPPVCRIMDYGKWKYQQRKKEQKARSHSKQSELKEVRLRPQIDPHDLEIKTKHARDFLGEGHKVQFTMQFKGREMAHRELGTELMNNVARSMEDISRKEDPKEPRAMGKRMTMMLIPERKGSMPNFLSSVNATLAVAGRSSLLCMAIAFARTFSKAASICASLTCASAFWRSRYRL